MSKIRSNVVMGYNGSIDRMNWSEITLWLKTRFAILNIQAPYLDYCTVKRRMRRFSKDLRYAIHPFWLDDNASIKEFSNLYWLKQDWDKYRGETAMAEGDSERVNGLVEISKIFTSFLEGYGKDHPEEGDHQVAINTIAAANECFDRIPIE